MRLFDLRLRRYACPEIVEAAQGERVWEHFGLGGLEVPRARHDWSTDPDERVLIRR